MIFAQVRVQAQNSDFTEVIILHAMEFCDIDQNGKAGLLDADNKKSLSSELEPFSNLHNAHVWLDSGELDKAYLETVEGLKTVSTDSIRQYLYLLQARIEIAKGLYQEASGNYQAFLEIHSGRAHELTSQVESSLGTLYLALEDYEAALALFKQGLASLDENNEKTYAKLVYHNLGLTYLHLEKTDSAEVYLNKSIELEKQAGDTVGLAISYMDIANLYYNQYLDDKAIPLFKLALETAVLSGNPEAMMNANKNMAVVEENRQNYASALEYRKAYEILQDGLWNRDRVWELAEKEKEFELSLQESRIALLEEREKVQQATLEIRNWQRNTFLLTSVAFLLLAGFLIWTNRFLKRKNLIISTQKAQLEALDQAKSKLYSIVAHDLRSPMRALQRSNEKIARAMYQESDQEKAMTAITENIVMTQRTYKLLDNLLHWSLDQSHQWLFQPAIHPLSALVEQVLYDYEPQIREQRIELKAEIQPEIRAYFDMASMKIVLRNLVDNALKYSPTGAKLHLAADSDSDHTSLKITDTGCGMDADQVASLFSLSRDKVKADAQGHRGTGLGMPLCKSFTEQNGGTLSVNSQPGVGTSITIRLPKEKRHGEG